VSEESQGTPDLPTPTTSPPPAHRRRRTVVRTGLAVLVVLILLVSGGAAYAYYHLKGNITTISDQSAPGVVRPSASPTPSADRHVKHTALNVLILGSDTRNGTNGFIGGEQGAGRSDTTIVLHLSANRKWAVGVSIPRDSMVQIPNCKGSNGAVIPAHLGMFNEAYTIGGPVCARDTVEQLTHLRLDHFLVVDFEGFRSMVTALGGVNVCLPQAINVPNIHLDLPAGKQKLDGLQALGYVRVRHIGDGSDLERISRQQTFLSALIQQVTSTKMLFQPTRLYEFLNAATKSLTTDKGLGSPSKLASLGEQVRTIGLSRIQFVTVPTVPYPPDHNRLQWASSAQTLWDLLANDEPLPGTAAAAKAASSATPSPTASPTASPLVAAPSTISVRVLNGVGTAGAAAKAAAELKALGYNVVGVGDTKHVSATVVRWSAPRDESARTLAAATGATTEEVSGLGQVVELVVGPDFTGASKVTITVPTSSASPAPTSSFGGRSASQNICS